ncbi:MAG: Thioredoxin 1 (modular protein) [Promethearchaeota archaeon]|nr:MAG: Thioredoxin 1 (modular protein) [Candidatus Lokiarchaeota archaeon]
MIDEELEEIKRKKAEKMMSGEVSNNLPDSIVHLRTPQDYDNLVKKHPDTEIIIDFGAEWCGPCKMYEPIFKKLQKEYKDDFIFAKIDVDENPVMARKYAITGVPTTLILKNNELKDKIVGLMNPGNMKQKLNQLKNK